MRVLNKINLLVMSAVFMISLFLIRPMTASAAEKVPGGKGNTVVVQARSSYKSNNYYDEMVESITLKAKDDVEIVGLYYENEGTLWFYAVYNNSVYSLYNYNGIGNLLNDAVGVSMEYKNGELVNTRNFSMSIMPIYFQYSSRPSSGITASGTAENLKLFTALRYIEAYAKYGDLDGMLKEPELDKNWYLKNIGYKVDADDSPTSEAGEDATYITFTWDTDNLQEGDLLEIKTHNYLTKIGGDRISGFHDYITRSNNVSSYSGKYRFSQYDATKAWFNTLDNKPLIFKKYDTDIYYLRPYREGFYGGWAKITMGRSPVTNGSPYVEDVEYGDFDDDDNWITDEDRTNDEGGHHGIDQGGNITYPDLDNPFEGTNVVGIFSWFFDFMKDMPSFLGDLPALVSTIIGFLPSQIIGFIAVGVVVAIILRIAGR